jgi:23S rRNA pseudouridine1911/1915/1917 synthase
LVTADAQHHGARLDKCLATWIPELSRSYLAQLIQDGCVKLSGTLALKPAIKVSAGQVVEIELRPTPAANAFRAEPVPLNIVFEDDHLLVINKPAGLVVHPGSGNWSGTILNGLLHHHEQAHQLPRAGIVHRLDKDTSGLMVVAKSRQAMAHLVNQLAARSVQRVYVALARGRKTTGDVFDIDQPIGRDPKNRLRMGVVPTGKPSQTQATVLDAHDPYLLLRCKLQTGRTHQIRVHMAWSGLPLVGDRLYGGRAELGMQAQALHAHDLSLIHPVTEAALHWWVPPPQAWLAAAELGGLGYNATSLL